MYLLKKDIVFRNLFINALLVILSYGAASLTALASNAIFQPIKVMFLVYSIFQVKKIFFLNDITKKVFVFGLLILVTVVFSIDPITSFKKFSTMVFPLIYISASINYLFKRYSILTILCELTSIFRLIYILPIISFIIFGGDLSIQSIYGETLAGFVSNHYGWSSYVFIISHIFLIKNQYSKLISFWSLFLIIAFILLILSGSRSSLLSLFLSFSIWLLFSKINILSKVLLVSLSASFIFVVLNSVSLDNLRIQKTLSQIDFSKSTNSTNYKNNSALLSDTRKSARDIGVITFFENPELMVTGFGFFKFNDGLGKYSPTISKDYYKSGIHNSYLELFFGCGIFVFLYFLWHFTIRPLFIYIRYFKTNLLLYVGVVLIIPFFESNITGGQFLFYPWFILILFLLNFNENRKV